MSTAHRAGSNIIEAAGSAWGAMASLTLLPGACHGCGQPVTTRGRRIVFDGENLIRPGLGPGTAVFHDRAGCRTLAALYDRAWAHAVPGRRRKLACPGSLTVHHGGLIECSEAHLCPGDVPHRAQAWHHPHAGAPFTTGCWCTTAQIAAAAHTDTETAKATGHE